LTTQTVCSGRGRFPIEQIVHNAAEEAASKDNKDGKQQIPSTANVARDDNHDGSVGL
jgi:hypothetical protein